MEAIERMRYAISSSLDEATLSARTIRLRASYPPAPVVPAQMTPFVSEEPVN